LFDWTARDGRLAESLFSQETGIVTSLIYISDAIAAESDGYIEFTVWLSAPATQAVTVNYATQDGSAGSGSGWDFFPDSGTLSFGIGETTKTIRVGLRGDTGVEPTEAFQLYLSGASTNAAIGNAYAVGTIVDEDATAGTPTVSVSDAIVDEKGKEAVFEFRLDRPSTGSVVLSYATIDGSATAGSGRSTGPDYSAASGTVSFAPGEMVKLVRVGIVDDATAESAESFRLTIDSVAGATLADTGATAVIGESDQAVQTKVAITIEDAVASEADGYAEFVVHLSGPSADVVTVTELAAIAAAAIAGLSKNGGLVKGYRMPAAIGIPAEL
jgi:hypothetical protein